MKLLLRAPNWLGDCVMALPAFAAVRRMLPDAQIDIVARSPLTQLYEMMPESMQRYLEGCKRSEVGPILKILAELTESTGFDSAVSTVNQALQYQTTDGDSLKNLYRRLYMDVPELPPMQLNPGIPAVQSIKPRLLAYDEFIKRKEVAADAGSRNR